VSPRYDRRYDIRNTDVIVEPVRSCRSAAKHSLHTSSPSMAPTIYRQRRVYAPHAATGVGPRISRREHDFSADSGALRPDIVNIITRSGTNDFHGNRLRSNFRNSAMDAVNLLAGGAKWSSRTASKIQYGVALGRPDHTRQELSFMREISKGQRRGRIPFLQLGGAKQHKPPLTM